MKVIIAGSREFTDYGQVNTLIGNTLWDADFYPTEVVSGTANGIDKFGEIWAESQRLPVKRFPADWKTHGKRAGYLRNAEMADYADALVAIWDGESRGTKHMIDLATKKGLRVIVCIEEPRG